MSPFRCFLLIAAMISGITASPLVAAQSAPRQLTQEDDVPSAYLSANGLLNRGLFELAAAEYRTFLAAQPHHVKVPVARYGLGVCCFRMNKFDEAVAELSQVRDIAGFEFAPEVAAMLAQCHMASGRPRDAAAEFARLLVSHGDHPLAQFAAAGLVEAHYFDGRYADAAAHSRKFLSRWPSAPVAERPAYFGAAAEMQLGRFEPAARLFESFLKSHASGPLAASAYLSLAHCLRQTEKLDEAAKAYRRASDSSDPCVAPDALLGLAHVLLAQGRSTDAIVALEHLVQRFPSSPAALSAALPRGRALFDCGDFHAALACFDDPASIKSQPDFAAYWASKCHLRLDKLDAAIDRLNAIQRDFPESPLAAEVRYDLAVALVRASKPADAVEQLSEFIRRFPRSALFPDALHLLAAVLHQERRFDESAAACRDFSDRFPTHTRLAAVQFLAAENEFLAGRLDSAVTAFRSFLNKHADDPNTHAARLHLGLAMARLERFDDAEPLLTSALHSADFDPAAAAGLLALADARFRRAEWKDAEALLERFLAAGDAQPGADDALLKLGLARLRQNRPEEALASFERLLASFPASDHRPQAAFERGQILLALNKPDLAADVFSGIADDPAARRFAPFALLNLGAIALLRTDYDSADQFLQRCLSADPDESTLRSALDFRSQALLAAQRFADAEKTLRELLQRFPDGEHAAPAAARLAITLARLEQFEPALNVIGRLLPTASKLPPDLDRALRQERAWCLRKLGRDEQAAEAYRELARADDAEPHVLLATAEIESAQRRLPRAAELLQRIQTAARSPDRVPPAILESALYRLGVIQYELNEHAAAVRTLTTLLDRFPTGRLAPSAAYFCGDAALKINQPDRAVECLSRVVDDAVADPQLRAPAQLRLGDALIALQHWPRAERTFADFIDRYPDSESIHLAHFGLGWARENQQRYDDAIEAYARVIARSKSETAARAQFQIGECLFARRKLEQAVTELLKVDILFAYPEWSAAALYEAGRCFDAMNKPAEAKAQYSAVVEKYPRSNWAALAQKSLMQAPRAVVPGHSP